MQQLKSIFIGSARHGQCNDRNQENPMNTQQLRTDSYRLLGALAIAGTVLSGSASAQYSAQYGVTVFTNTNFRGESVSLRDDTPNLVPYGLNDKVRSIQIPAGEAWEVCTDVDYGNGCRVLTGSVSDLRSIGWGDRISSIRRVSSSLSRSRRYPGAVGTTGWFGSAGVTVFTNPNFGGQSATFTTDTPDLVQYGLNDKISSIEIPEGEAWEVCTDVGYGNGCQVLTGSVSDLRRMGWSDRISSLRRVGSAGYRRNNRDVYESDQSDPSQTGLVFYGRPGFRGASRVVTSGSTNVGWAARSIQVRGGGPWEVCDNYGECATVNQSVSDVSELGLNGRITSVRPLRNSRFSRYRQ
jgi:hypothetical protein